MPALTDTKARNARPAEKPYKLQDGQGLYLDVHPSGAKVGATDTGRRRGATASTPSATTQT
ncbi:MAG: Arm DNA-binding domain-containing protein [Azoarcus sp.]|jgi:hypothetical protein|nr:Arm DNA-binding domain-containing protein [Azoarcus sp.]